MGQIKTRKGTKPVSTGARAAYKRVLLKLSGEALQGEGLAINPNVVLAIGKQLADIHALGIEIGIVIGGGNIFRGMKAAARGMDRSTADYMGMLATVINALALQDGLEKSNVPTRVLTAIQMQSVAEPYIRRRAMRHMEKGRVVIFAAGTGNPYFSTDTTAALRAVEIGADVLLKATKVDGIYDADPLENPRAKFFPEMAYLKVLQKNLKVMDSTAVTLCRDNELPIIVFNLAKPQNIRRVIMGEKIGTLVH